MKLLLTGIPASQGTARGRARVLDVPAEGQILEEGDILVTVVTDPMSFVDIIDNAAALVTDLGGITSHPAILARELGIPCVVGTKTGTQTIQEGMTIEVDGSAGTIHQVG